MIVSDFLFSQILVTVAAIFDLFSFQTRSRKTILACLAISSALVAIHFFILGSSTAGCCALITCCRFVVAYLSKDRRWILLFVAITGLVLLFTYRTPLNILPFAASIFGTVGSFHGSDKALRVFIMAATFLWIVHNTLIGSPAAVALELAFLISNLVGYWRFYLRLTPKA